MPSTIPTTDVNAPVFSSPPLIRPLMCPLAYPCDAQQLSLADDEVGPVARANHVAQLWAGDTLVVFGGEGATEGPAWAGGEAFVLLGDLWALNLTEAFGSQDGDSTEVRGMHWVEATDASDFFAEEGKIQRLRYEIRSTDRTERIRKGSVLIGFGAKSLQIACSLPSRFATTLCEKQLWQTAHHSQKVDAEGRDPCGFENI